MALDPIRRRLYYVRQPVGWFFVISLDGRILSSRQLVKSGPRARLEYPQLNVDTKGLLHVAWTTQEHTRYSRWDIHHMLSSDGGVTWRNLDGTPLSLPVLADHTGKSLRITPDDEFSVYTWLSNFTVRASKVHFMYLAQTAPSQQHYMTTCGTTSPPGGETSTTRAGRFGARASRSRATTASSPCEQGTRAAACTA